MNKKILNLSYDDLLFVDIETVRGEKEFTTDHPFYDVWAWKQRNTETNEIPDSEKVIQSYYNKAALFAEWGKIVCISVGYIHKDEIRIKSFVGDEADILQDFVDVVQKTGRKLVAHNIQFDIPYIRKRWFINGLPHNGYLGDSQGNDTGMKPWSLETILFDTMALWKGVGFQSSSLDELAMCFGIPSSKDGAVTGANVGEAYYDGRIQEIAEYCEKDVAVLTNVFRCWKGDGILDFTSDTAEQLKPKSILSQLQQSKELTEAVKEEVSAILKKKRATKKDKQVLKDILYSVILKSDFDSKDSKEDVQRKKQEVEDFIDSL